MSSRLLVKQLVSQVLSTQLNLELKTIEIGKQENGVPFITVKGLGRMGWLSMSHSNNSVLAAFSLDEKERFGVDVEWIEPRPINLFEDYFTPIELRWISSLKSLEQDFVSNLIWSSKEAFLKAIEKGLQMDTRKIEIEPLDHDILSRGWKQLSFSLEKLELLEWLILFQRQDNYVQTICLPKNHALKFVDFKSIM